MSNALFLNPSGDLIGNRQVYYTFERVTFRRSYNREFRERYSRFLELIREDAVKEGGLVDEQAMVTQASKIAHGTILRNMKGER